MPRHRAAAVAFPVGAAVEVGSTDVGFKGSWYEATVTRARPRRRAYDVDYAALVADDDPSQPLRETVRASHVRPRAPRLADGARYAVHELVDGFHNDGWWPAVVSAAGEGDPPDRYTVCFPGSREVFDFAPLEIRPHREWRQGRWFTPANQREAIFREGEQIEVSGDRENYGAVWFTGTVVKVIAKAIYLVEYKKPKEDGIHYLFREFLDAQYIRPVRPPTSGGVQFVMLEEIDVFHCDVWKAGVISKIVDSSRYVAKLTYEEEEIELSLSEMRKQRDWVNGKWAFGNKVQHRGRKSLASKKAIRPVSVSSSPSVDIEQTNTLSLKRKMGEGAAEGPVEALLPTKERKMAEGALEGSVDQLLTEMDPKTPIVDKEVHAAMEDLESPPSELIVGSLHVDEGSQKTLLFDEHFVEQRLPNGNGTTELVVWGEEPPNSTEDLSKTQSANHLLSTSETTNPITTGDCSMTQNANHLLSTPETGNPNSTEDLSKIQSANHSLSPLESGNPNSTEDLSKTQSANHSLSPPESGNPNSTEDLSKTQSANHSLYPPESGYPNFAEDLSKTQSGNHSVSTPVTSNSGLPSEWDNSKGGQIGKLVLPSEWGSSKGVRGPRGPRASGIKHRKKLVGRERRLQEVFDVIDVRKHSKAETKRKRGRPRKSANLACTKLQLPKSSDKVIENNGRSKGVNLSRSAAYDFKNDIRSLQHQDGLMTYENSPTVFFKGLLKSDAGNSTANKQDGTRTAHNFTPQMVSFAQVGMPASFLTDKGTSSFVSGINDTAKKARPPHLKGGGSVARLNKTEEHCRFGSNHIVGNKAERMSHQAESTDDVTDKNHTSNISSSKESCVEDLVLFDQAPISSSLMKTPPFVKSSPLWESVESMEVFKAMPQEPHFRLLEQQYCREFREGLAIGLMVTFANLEAEARKMGIFDSQEIFEERLKALEHLEENGFDVQNLRSRIEELLEIRNTLNELQNKNTFLREQMLEIEYEKDQIDTVKLMVDKTIKEVEQHLNRLFRKRDSLVAQKMHKESEIAEVQKDVNATEAACLCVEQQFHAISTSPWLL